MIPKSGYRFSGKIMLKQRAEAKCGLNLKSFRFRLLLNSTSANLVSRQTTERHFAPLGSVESKRGLVYNPRAHCQALSLCLLWD